MHLRKFTEEGVRKFVAFLNDTRAGGSTEVPESLLTDPANAELVNNVAAPPPGCATKLAFAKAAHAAFIGAGIDESLRSDRHVWMWLTALYFPDLCKDAKGQPRRPLTDIHRYATTGLGRDYPLDKNLLYFPWKLLLLHGDSAHWMLEAPLGADTKVTRELANSYRKNVHTEFVELARRLYFDEARRVLRKGATNSKAAGNLRDLERTIGRLDLTYDVFGASADQLLTLLPVERFGRWTKRA